MKRIFPTRRGKFPIDEKSFFTPLYKYVMKKVSRLRLFLYFCIVLRIGIKITIIILLLTASSTSTKADPGIGRIFEGIEGVAEAQVTTSDGEHNPLWLNANKYGLSSVENSNGYLRGSIVRDLNNDSLRKWGIGYGVDLAVASHFTSKFIVQQAFVEGRYKRGVLTIGSKQHELNLKNQELSSGSQTLGINARPLPEVRIEMPDYWEIPGLKGWLAFRGHLAYGIQTDDNWQEEFTEEKSKYTEKTLYHSKSGFLRIGPDNLPLQFELGMEWGCQFGGRSYGVSVDGKKLKIWNQQDFKAIWHAFMPDMGKIGDADESIYSNSLGNHLGSWVARLTYKGKGWKVAAYIDHYFEDHSQLLFLDFDGYGSGDDWDKKKDNRFYRYKFKDCLIGLEGTLPRNPFVSTIVAEYIYTKYQSGPIFHDHTITISDHYAGRDDYYNHHIFSGWQHWGQVMGNPLYLSPIYNESHKIQVEDNRFSAWHFGVNGDPTDNVHYRLLATFQKGYGTYSTPYPDPRNNFSFLAEAAYDFSSLVGQKGWSIKGAFALDRGKLMGDNTGCQFTLTKQFGK